MQSDEQIFAEMCGGKVRAFDVLYERYEQRLFGFALSYLKNRQEAEEVFHEAFLRLIQLAARIQTGAAAEVPKNVEAWLFTVSRNLSLNRLRKANCLTHGLGDLPAAPPAQDSVLISKRRNAALGKAIGALPRDLEEMCQLRASGQSYEDIAQILDLPVGTVKSRFHNLIKKLRKDLEEWIAR